MAKNETKPTATGEQTTNASQTAAATAAERVAPILAAPRTDVPAPVRKRSGGASAVSAYKAAFDSLTAIGQSFGVLNKSKKQMQGVVSNENRKAFIVKTDANGATVFKMKELDDGNGGKVSVPTQEPEKVQTKHFIVVEVDPKTDPDGATARVYRDL